LRHTIRTATGEFRDVNMQPLKAVKYHCAECVGWEREAIWEACRVGDCNLYPFRNGKRVTGAGSVLKAIRKECLGCMGGKGRKVADCPDEHCALFPYRLGRNPARTGMGRKGSKMDRELGFSASESTNSVAVGR
jgi:hypothetical protein